MLKTILLKLFFIPLVLLAQEKISFDSIVLYKNASLSESIKIIKRDLYYINGNDTLDYEQIQRLEDYFVFSVKKENRIRSSIVIDNRDQKKLTGSFKKTERIKKRVEGFWGYNPVEDGWRVFIYKNGEVVKRTQLKYRSIYSFRLSKNLKERRLFNSFINSL